MRRAEGFYSATQFGLWRMAFGLYLSYYLILTFPYAPEIYSRNGIFSDPDILWNYSVFPVWFLHFDSEATIRVLFLISMALALMIALGIWRRMAALCIWAIFTFLLSRNPSTAYSPEVPYIQWLLLACTLVPAGEAWSLTARDRKWSMPKSLYNGAWLVVTVGYFYAGYEKLISVDASWRNGTAVYYAIEYEPTRRMWFGEFFNHVPMTFFFVPTMLTLLGELGGVVCLFSIHARCVWFLIMMLMHISVLFLSKLDQVSLGMIVVQFFLWDHRWLRFFLSKNLFSLNSKVSGNRRIKDAIIHHSQIGKNKHSSSPI